MCSADILTNACSKLHAKEKVVFETQSGPWIDDIINGNTVGNSPIFHLVDCQPKGGDTREKGEHALCKLHGGYNN